MLATLSGDLCLLFGLGLLLLPLLAVELSRPAMASGALWCFFSAWCWSPAATNCVGAPMLAVLCGSLLISRLSAEVGQARWMALSEEERQRLGSIAHWLTSLHQLGTAVSSLGEGVGGIAKQLKPSGRSGVANKIWVRPEDDTNSAEAGRRSSSANQTLRPPRTPSRTDNPPIQQ